VHPKAQFKEEVKKAFLQCIRTYTMDYRKRKTHTAFVLEAYLLQVLLAVHHCSQVMMVLQRSWETIG
jgi:hypothetical protein